MPVLRALARFGLPLLTDPVEGRVRPRTAVYGALAPLIDGPAAAGRNLVMRFVLDGEELWLQVRDGRLERPDRGVEPDLTFTGSAAALVELCRGTADLAALTPTPFRARKPRSARGLHRATRRYWRRSGRLTPDGQPHRSRDRPPPGGHVWHAHAASPMDSPCMSATDRNRGGPVQRHPKNRTRPHRRTLLLAQAITRRRDPRGTCGRAGARRRQLAV